MAPWRPNPPARGEVPAGRFPASLPQGLSLCSPFPSGFPPPPLGPPPPSPTPPPLDPCRVRLAAQLAETARLKHAGLDLRKLDDPRRRTAPLYTESAGVELAGLLQAAEGEAERLTRAWLVTPCSAATIRQTEAAWAHAEATGALPPSPQGEHPEVIVLRFEAAEEAEEARRHALRLAWGETNTFTLHATAAEGFQAAPGLRVERIEGLRDPLLLVIRPTPGPDGAALLTKIANGDTVFLAARPARQPALRRATALRRLLQRWESAHLPLLNLFNPEPKSWGDAQALQVGHEAEAWQVLAPAETAAREFVRKAIGSPDFALLDAATGPARTRATAELILQVLRRGQRVLLTAATGHELEAVLNTVLAHPEGARLVAPLRLLALGEVSSEKFRTFTLEARIATLQRVGPVLLKRDEAERVAFTSANLTFGTFDGLTRLPALRPAQLAREAEGFDQLIVVDAAQLTFADFLPLAVHATKWTLIGNNVEQPTTPGRTELAALAAAEAERAGHFTELQAELAYKACVGKDGSADDEDAELADAYGRRKVLLVLETSGEDAPALTRAVQYLRSRQLTVAVCPLAETAAESWSAPATEINVIVTTRACVEQTDLLARLSTDFRLVVTDAPSAVFTALAVRMKAPKTRGRVAKPRPVILLSWSLRTAENLRGLHAQRHADAARGEHARSLLLDLRCIFPFEKPLWEPRALLTLLERTLPSVTEVLHHGVRADTGTGRSELVYHSGLPRGSSLNSRLEVLR